MNEDHILQHYGIKGMKWGVSRPRGSDGRVKGSKKTDSDDRTSLRKTQAKGKKTGIGSLTNNEITTATRRIDMEARYSSLNPGRGARVLSSVKKGTAIAGTVLAVGSTVNQAMKFVDSPAGAAIGEAIGIKAPPMGKHSRGR